MIPPDAAQANIDERKRRYREMADALIPKRKRHMGIEAQEWLCTIPEYMRGKLVIAGHISPQIKDMLISAFAETTCVATEQTEEYLAHTENNSIDALYITTDGRNDPQGVVDMWVPKLKENGFFYWNIEA